MCLTCLVDPESNKESKEKNYSTLNKRNTSMTWDRHVHRTSHIAKRFKNLRPVDREDEAYIIVICPRCSEHRTIKSYFSRLSLLVLSLASTHPKDYPCCILYSRKDRLRRRARRFSFDIFGPTFLDLSNLIVIKFPTGLPRLRGPTL